MGERCKGIEHSLEPRFDPAPSTRKTGEAAAGKPNAPWITIFSDGFTMPWFGRTKYCLGLVVLILKAIGFELRLKRRSCFVE